MGSCIYSDMQLPGEVPQSQEFLSALISMFKARPFQQLLEKYTVLFNREQKCHKTKNYGMREKGRGEY